MNTFTSLSCRQWRCYQDQAGREWAEEMAEEEEHNRVMALPMSDALDELFEDNEHEIRRLIKDAIKDRLHYRWDASKTADYS